MKRSAVLLDEGFHKRFVPLLQSEIDARNAPFFATTVKVLGWAGTSNGTLQELCLKNKIAVFISEDKNLPFQTKPDVPVFLLDKVYAEDFDVVAPTLAELLANNIALGPDYYPVMLEGAEPSEKLRRVAIGAYNKNPRLGFPGNGYFKSSRDARPAVVVPTREDYMLIEKMAREHDRARPAASDRGFVR